MKKLIALAWLAALPNFAAMPIIIVSPTLIFYASGVPPVSYGGVKVLEPVTVDLYASAQGQMMNISGLQVTGDMLLITSNVNGTAASGSIVFKHAGVYRAFIDRGGSNLISAGTFRVLPSVTVDPAAPSTANAVKITLALGEIYPGDCMPVYSSKATVRGTDILLSFTELAVGACMSPADTMTYGPTFDLGKLPGGAYAVYIEDSVAVGSFSVTAPLRIMGTAHVMQSRYLRRLAQPVDGASITAVQYQPCSWGWYGPGSVDTNSYRDTTDAAGVFTVITPDNQSNYDLSASKTGFHDQAIPVDVGGSLFQYDPDSNSIPFEMIPSVVNAVTVLEVRVTDNGAPLESAYVSLEPGRGIALCPMLLAKAGAILPPAASYGGYTGKSGAVSIQGISLVPYIDFTWSVSKYSQGKSLYDFGKIRLNLYDPDTLKISFGGTCVEGIVSGLSRSLCSVTPNPFNPSTTLRVSRPGVRLAVYDVAGKLVKDFGAVPSRSVNWTPVGLANGIYVVKAVDGKRTSVQKILFQK